MSTSTKHEVVILGANFGGIDSAHSILRQTIPQLEKLDKSKSYHVTLVSPNTHFFFKIASPRALINSTLIPQDKIFKPIAEAFAQYPASHFTFVQGVATSLDPSQHNVTVQFTGAETGEHVFPYNSLIISTGTTSESPLWTLHGDHTLTINALNELHTALPTAKSVIIVGGGPVGCETAGEIASAFPSIKITLFSGSDRLLKQVLPATGARAQSYLESNMKVEVIHNLRVTNASASGSSTTIKLSDGTERTADIYIDATGGRKVNTQFLPGSWLDETKHVITRGEGDFRVKGTGTDADGVYVIGDAVAGSTNTAIELDAMIPTTCSSLAIDIASTLVPGAPMAKEEDGGLIGNLLAKIFGGKKNDMPKPVKFSPMKGTLVVPIGPGGGVGQLMGYWMPTFMVKMVKAKNFLLELVQPMISGEKRKKA